MGLRRWILMRRTASAVEEARRERQESERRLEEAKPVIVSLEDIRAHNHVQQLVQRNFQKRTS